MKLTPLEVETEKFARRLRGYDTAEVDAFKRLVAVRLEELLRENAALKEQVAHLREEVHELQAREQGIQETLYTARQLSEEMKSQARREADILRVEAELEGEQLKQAAEQELRALHREIRGLRGQRERMLVEFRAVLESHWRMLEVHAEQPPGAGRPKPPRPPEGAPPRTTSPDPVSADRSRLSISALLARGRQIKGSDTSTSGGARRGDAPARVATPGLRPAGPPEAGDSAGRTASTGSPRTGPGAVPGEAAAAGVSESDPEHDLDLDLDIDLGVDVSELADTSAEATTTPAPESTARRGPVLEIVSQDGKPAGRRRKRRRTPAPDSSQRPAEDAKG